MTKTAICSECARPLDTTDSSLCPACRLTRIFPELQEAAPEGAGMVELENYEVGTELGRGGNGVVYAARHRELGFEVAIKVLTAGPFTSPSGRARFLREAQVAAKLKHPNLVRTFEFGQSGHHTWFAMDRVPGKSLGARLREKLPVPRQSAEWIREIANAVAYAHSHGVIHRDIKPENILIDALGEPYLTDFGLAAVADGEALTLTRQAIGTFHYTAPEQLSSSGAAGPAADIYSLGAVLYECLTGRPPFNSATVGGLIHAVLENEPVSPRELNPGIPADIETICLKALRKRPEDRYASAEELAEDLRRFTRGEPVKARPIGRLTQLWRWSSRHPVTVILAFTLALVLLSATLLSLRHAAEARALAGAEAEARERAEDNYHALQREWIRGALQRGVEHAEEGESLEALARFGSVLRLDPLNRVATGWILQLINRPIAVALSEEQDSVGRVQQAFAAGDRFLIVSENGKITALSGDELRVDWTIDAPQEVLGAELSADESALLLQHTEGVSLFHIESGNPQFTWDLREPLVSSDISRAGTYVAAATASGVFLRGPDGRDRLISTRTNVTVLEWGSSSDFLALGLSSGRVETLWPLQGTNRVLMSFNLNAPVTDLSISGNGERLVFGAANGQIAVAQMSDGAAVGRILQRRAPIHQVEFNTDGDHYIQIDSSRVARVHTLSGGIRRVLPLHASSAGAFFSKDGRHILAPERNGDGRITEVLRSRPSIVLKQKDAASHIAMNRAGTKVLAVTKSGRMRLWALQSSEKEPPTFTHDKPIRDARFWGQDGGVAVLDIEGAVWALNKDHNAWPLAESASAMKVAPSGGFLAVQRGETIEIWVRRNAEPQLVSRLQGVLKDLQFSSDGSAFTWRTGADKLLMRDASGNERIIGIPPEPGDYTWLNGDNRLLLASPERIALLDLQGKVIADNPRACAAAAVSPNGLLIVARKTGGPGLVVLGLPELERVSELKEGAELAGFQFLNDQLIGAETRDGQGRLWALSNPGRPRHVFEDLRLPTLAPGTDGFLGLTGERVLWIFSQNDQVRPWDLEMRLPSGLPIRHYSPFFPPTRANEGAGLLISDGPRELVVHEGSQVSRALPRWMPNFLEEVTGYSVGEGGHLEWNAPATLAQLKKKYPLDKVHYRETLPLLFR